MVNRNQDKPRNLLKQKILPLVTGIVGFILGNVFSTVISETIKNTLYQPCYSKLSSCTSNDLIKALDNKGIKRSEAYREYIENSTSGYYDLGRNIVILVAGNLKNPIDLGTIQAYYLKSNGENAHISMNTKNLEEAILKAYNDENPHAKEKTLKDIYR